MQPFRSIILRAALFLFLGLSSSAILYTTTQNTRSARALSDQALEETALASTLEAELRSGDHRGEAYVRRILSDGTPLWQGHGGRGRESPGGFESSSFGQRGGFGAGGGSRGHGRR
ncbi:MAG: hypothetical protein HY787_17360 [Deltaproteobacteria bacterium]|nr:hypothetical protein [Deltaproteobacteria bacterium]